MIVAHHLTQVVPTVAIKFMNIQQHFDRINEQFSLYHAIIYPYGSHNYGTATYNSDYDYIVVAPDADNGREEIIHHYNDELNIHFHTPDHWQQMVEEHKIFALESIFQNQNDPYRKRYFKLDLQKLRKEISEKSSNSWVKCKKKLIVEHDFRIGLKSLFHSFRILEFGIQIAEHGTIIDYISCASWYRQIMEFYPFLNAESAEDEWNKLHTTFKSQHNQLSTKFKLLAPK